MSRLYGGICFKKVLTELYWDLALFKVLKKELTQAQAKRLEINIKYH